MRFLEVETGSWMGEGNLKGRLREKGRNELGKKTEKLEKQNKNSVTSIAVSCLDFSSTSRVRV